MRHKSGKQDRTAQMALLHAVCGQGVGSGPELKSILPRFDQFWIILFILLADMRPSFGLLVAQIWQTGTDHPNVIILRSMWARAKVLIWARIKNNSHFSSIMLNCSLFLIVPFRADPSLPVQLWFHFPMWG